jgi:hypothetical protein
MPAVLDTLSWNIEPLYDEYRDMHIKQGFNWPKLLAEVSEFQGLNQSQYYLVSFRSTRREGDAITRKIEELDTAAFQEAKMSPALLHYFGGNPNEYGQAVSWCLWTDAPSAHATLTGIAHKEAANAAMELYETYEVDCYDVFPQDEQDIIFSEVARHKS